MNKNVRTAVGLRDEAKSAIVIPLCQGAMDSHLEYLESLSDISYFIGCKNIAVSVY